MPPKAEVTEKHTTCSVAATRKRTTSSAADTANKRTRLERSDEEDVEEDTNDGSDVEEEDEDDLRRHQSARKGKLPAVATARGKSAVRGKAAAPASKGRLVPEVVIMPRSKQGSSSAAVSSTIDDDEVGGILVKKAKKLPYVNLCFTIYLLS